MAYNPFDFFRRNQKILFAVITVLVMFMFVLSFGQGDFFSWLPKQMAKWQSTGAVLGTLDGSTIKESHIGEVEAKRELANSFMNELAGRNVFEARKQATEDQKAAGNGLKGDPKVAQEIGTALFWGGIAQEAASRPDQQFQFYYGEMMRAYEKLGALAEDSKIDPESKRSAKSARAYLGSLQAFIVRVLNAEKGNKATYFTGQPDVTPEDRVDYLLWLKKADQLGIRFAPEDVTQLVANEFPSLSEKAIEEYLGEKLKDRRYKVADYTEALGNEFRVRAAQVALLGNDARENWASAASAPKEQLDAFTKDTTGTKYTFLTVPVSAFLERVKNEPSEADLKKIFNAAKKTDPNPESKTPGIREPRKVKLQWIEVTGQEPYYDAPTKALTQRLAGVQSLTGPTATFDKLSIAKPTQASATNRDTILVTYENYQNADKRLFGYWSLASSNPGKPKLQKELLAFLTGYAALPDYEAEPIILRDRTARLADASLAKIHNVAVLTGLFGGSFGSAASLMTAPVLVTETAYRSEMQDRLITGLQAFHFPILPGLGQMVETAGADGAVIAGLPKPLPTSVVQPVLDEMTASLLRFKVVEDDLAKFEKELAKLIAQPDKPLGRKQAAEYTAKFIAERGFKVHSTTELRDLHNLGDDSAIQTLVFRDIDLLKPDFNLNSRKKSIFGYSFFYETRETDNKGKRVDPVTGVYSPRVYDPQNRAKANSEGILYAPSATPNFGYAFALPTPAEPRPGLEPITVFWRTEDIEPATPLDSSDPKVAEKLRAIWRFEKARELARNAAKDAENILREGGDNEAKVAQQIGPALAALRKEFAPSVGLTAFREFSPPDFVVSKIPYKVQTNTEQPPELTGYMPRHDSIVYESEKMREELIANRDKPIGTAFTFTDKPESMFYVTVVASKDAKSRTDFKNYIYQPSSMRRDTQYAALSPQMLAPRFTASAREEARARASALLRAEFNWKGEPKKDEGN